MRSPSELVRFLIPLTVLGAIAAVREPSGEGFFLGELSAAVLLVVAALAPAPAFELGLGSVLAVTAIWAFPPGPGRGAAVMVLLVAAFLFAAVRRLSRDDLSPAVAIPLALGAQLLLRSELLWEPPSLRTGVALLVLPLAAGVAMAVLSARQGREVALIAACVVVLAGPGWNVTTTLVMAAISAVGFFLPTLPRLSPIAPLVLGVLLGLTALLDAYPWRRTEPVRDALRLPAFQPAPATTILPPETSITLDAAYPSREVRLSPEPVSTLVLESALSNGARLENGTPVAVLRLTDPSGKTVERILRAGEDTGEWAAKRPDVLSTARLKSPEPWVSWFSDDFLAQRYRTRWDLPVPGSYSKARLALSPGLPRDVSLTVHQLELRRLSGFPLAPGDPFRGTILFLPVVLLGFAWIQRKAIRQGARPLDRAGTAAELAALGILALLALSRPHLNLGRADEIIAAGFVLVLGSRVARQVRAFRPLLGERLPDRLSGVFFLLPLVAYLAVLPWAAAHRQPDGDEPWYLLITHSLAYDFDAELTNNYAREDWRHFMERPIQPQPGDPVGPDGELYSRHNETLPLALAPAYRLAGKTGALGMMAVFSAALAWATLRLTRRYFPDHPGEALAAWAIFSFTPPLLLYAVQIWVEVPATLLLVVALDRISGFDGRRRWDWAEWLAVGLPALLLPLVKMRLMMLAAPLVPLAWWHAGRPRKRILVLGGLLAALGAGILVYNHFLYGNPFKIHSFEEIDPQRHTWLDYAKGGLGLFWDTAFGLFGSAPIWMLILPALLLLAFRRSRLLVHLAVLALPYLAIVVPRIEWYGGWSPPFRYALIALPLLAISLVPLFARMRDGGRALLAGLAALTLALTLVWVVVPGWTYSFANGRTYPLDALSERLGSDVARFFPSSVRPRAATWIWPPVSLALLALVWWLPLKRGKEGAALAGLAAVFLGAAALPLAADRLTTRVVELEDPYVWKSGGHIYPDLWVLERARHRGGWVLRIGETLKAPVAPGGRRVEIELQGQLIRNQPVPYHLDVRAGDKLLAVWVPGRNRVWESVKLGPFDWPAGEPLVLAAYGPYPPGAPNGALLDRVVMRWE